jgi:shikimate 5-dehydrogenase
MAYGPGVTLAMGAAIRLGVPAADGLDVLVAQAAISFRWWTGEDASLEAMQAAARRF